jgi:hypothetical protein
MLPEAYLQLVLPVEEAVLLKVMAPGTLMLKQLAIFFFLPSIYLMHRCFTHYFFLFFTLCNRCLIGYFWICVYLIQGLVNCGLEKRV